MQLVHAAIQFRKLELLPKSKSPDITVQINKVSSQSFSKKLIIDGRLINQSLILPACSSISRVSGPSSFRSSSCTSDLCVRSRRDAPGPCVRSISSYSLGYWCTSYILFPAFPSVGDGMANVQLLAGTWWEKLRRTEALILIPASGLTLSSILVLIFGVSIYFWGCHSNPMLICT